VVTTPRRYPTAAAYYVTVGKAHRAQRIMSSPRGQLTITVPLGSSAHTVAVHIRRAT
jgi:hypothetical protein